GGPPLGRASCTSTLRRYERTAILTHVRVGVVFPQLEIGTDPAKIRAYVQAAEELGYTHLVAFDHVLGADISTRPDWRGAYDAKSTFHEVFVLFGFLRSEEH